MQPFSSPEPSVSFGHMVGETKGSGRTQKFNFFHWLIKIVCAEQIKITSTTRYFSLAARMAGTSGTRQALALFKRLS